MTAKPLPAAPADLDAKRRTDAARQRRKRWRDRNGKIAILIEIDSETLDLLANLREIEAHHHPDHPQFDKAGLATSLGGYVDQSAYLDARRAEADTLPTTRPAPPVTL